MSALDPKVVDRLACLCGMFTSSFAGEQATAATMATSLLRQHGLTWREVITRAFQVVVVDPEPEPSRDLRSVVNECLAASYRLSDWERQFLENIRWEYWYFADLSDKQAKILDQIVAKVRRARK